MATTLSTRPLTVDQDLTVCDVCGVPGLRRYILPSGRDLVLCGHHGREHGPDLVADGARSQAIR
jgi:hypothetical protein